MSAPDRAQLKVEAQRARERLLGVIHQLDTRGKTLARDAIEVTQVSAWGIAGAVALWAGIALLTRERRRNALVRNSRPSLSHSALVRVVRVGAAITGFLASRAWAQRFMAARHLRHAVSPGSPHMRQLSAGAQPLLAAELSQSADARGTTDA